MFYESAISVIMSSFLFSNALFIFFSFLSQARVLPFQLFFPQNNCFLVLLISFLFFISLISFILSFLKFYFRVEWREESEKQQWEREADWLPPDSPWLGIEPEISVCSDQESNLPPFWCTGLHSNQLRHTARPSFPFLLSLAYCIFFWLHNINT